MHHHKTMIPDTLQRSLFAVMESLEGSIRCPLKVADGQYTQLFNVDLLSSVVIDGQGVTDTPLDADARAMLMQTASLCYQEKDVRVSLCEVVVYPVGGSTPAHIDCVPGTVAVVSIGCAAKFTSEGVTHMLESGDVVTFPGDITFAISHQVDEVMGEGAPPWCNQTRVIFQFRQAPPPTSETPVVGVDHLAPRFSAFRSLPALQRCKSVNAGLPLVRPAGTHSNRDFWKSVAVLLAAKDRSALACTCSAMLKIVQEATEPQIGTLEELRCNFRPVDDEVKCQPCYSEGFLDAVVVELGSRYIRIGQAGGDFPVFSFEAAISVDPADSINALVGSCASRSASVSRPLVSGDPLAPAEEWRLQVSTLLRYALARLGFTPALIAECCCLVVLPRNRRENLVSLCASLFLDLGFAACNAADSGVCALYCAGLTTGLVVECTRNCARVTPVYEGYSLPHAYQLVPLLLGSVEADAASVSQAVTRSVRHCDSEIRDDLDRSTVICGDLAVSQEFTDALQRAMQGANEQVSGFLKPAEFRATVSGAAPNDAWIGGSILGSLTTFKGFWVSRDVYESQGVDAVLRRFSCSTD